MAHEITTLGHFGTKTEKSFKEIFSEVFFSPFFYVPLFVKILFSFFFASSFATELFIPFIQYFVENITKNPYTHFFETGTTNAFPYPMAMLLIVSLPFFLANVIGLPIAGVTIFSLALLRFSLLIADLILLFILISWFKEKKKEVLIFYFCSPVLLYITYIHGQMDVIPITLLFLAIFFLFRKKDLLAFIVLGVSIAAKTSTFLTLPLFVFYLLRERSKIYWAFLCFFISLFTFFIINGPVIFSKGFFELVFKTKEQLKVFDLYISFNSAVYVYITPFLLGVLFLYIAKIKRYSKNVFVTFLGISFASILFTTIPRPGWYFWVIPFIVYLYIQLPSSKRWSLHLLSFFYFSYFIITKDSDLLKPILVFFDLNHQTLYSFLESRGFNASFLSNIAFTFLQGSLLYVIYTMYRYGFYRQLSQKLFYKPFVIGIAGDSGSGKTTLAKLLENIFSPLHTTILAGDDMHKWERGDNHWAKYTHLNPMANNLHQEIFTLQNISQDESFFRKIYDHNTGRFTNALFIKPKRLVIFEGLHTFFLRSTRESYDLKIFVLPEEQLRMHWKILRDQEKRGYSKEKIFEQIEKRKEDRYSYIATQEKYADLIFSLRNETSLGPNLGNKEVHLNLFLFIYCINDIYLEPILSKLSEHGLIHFAIYDDRQHIKIKLHDFKKDILENIASSTIKGFTDLVGEDIVFSEGYEGIMQLITIYCIFKKNNNYV